MKNITGILSAPRRLLASAIAKPRRVNSLARSLLAGASLLAFGLAAITAHAATATFNFNNGLQGWTQIGTTTRSAWNSGGNAWGATQAGSIFGYDGDDGADNTYWVRSPVFRLDGSGPLTIRLWGGRSTSPAPANVTDVPATQQNGTGFKGVVLRDVLTGNYVKSLSVAADNGNADYSLSVADLAPYANDGKDYTLDYLDYYYGGWGWFGMDNVTIPGTLITASITIASPSVVKGSTVTGVVSLPPTYNASSAVTVWVTNSNPAVVTVNGSPDPVITLTFAAGGANTQNISLAGTALGFAKLTTGSTTLYSTSANLTVLPASGLMGRWLTGTEDLVDKSGYSPAGTHDGVLSGGLTPIFVQDAPPTAPVGAFSIDLASSGGAILITNSMNTDLGYKPTFDDAVAMQISVVCWAKGLPGGWNPFVSKYGEDSTGWQLRRRGGDPVATFTVRSTGGEDDPYNGQTFIDDMSWHHFAATWDGVAGVRKLYVDGKLNCVVPQDGGPMGLANVNYLTLGGRSGANSTTPGNLFAGQLYDVQIYGMALTGSAVQDLYNANTAAVMAYADSSVIDLGQTGTVSVAIPVGANATTAVTVYVTNTTPAVVSLAGAVNNVVTLTFPAGGGNSQTVTLTGLVEGQAQLACTANGLTSASLAVNVYGPHLVARWLDGTESYNNVSTFTPAGTHDGVEIGNAGTMYFTNNTPPSKPGKAAYFPGGVGLMINNSSTLDGGYVPTFDDLLARKCSIAFWAKGFPGEWNPFVSKRGEDSMAWQVRRQGNSVHGTFTLRGTPGNDDPEGAIAIDDGGWHHFAAVWDGAAGTRKLYIDGILDANVNLTGDFGPMMTAGNHHVVLGGRENGGVSLYPTFGNYFTGSLYDVRVYNYPLTVSEVKDLSFIAAIKAIPALISLEATKTNKIDVILPAGANQTQPVTVQVVNQTPAQISLQGAAGNTLTLTYPVGGSLTQQVYAVGITDGKATLTASGGGFVAGTATFNVYTDPGSRLIGRWFSGDASFAETSGFRPAGTHDAVPVAGAGADPSYVMFSGDVPAVAPVGAQSLDLTIGPVAVMITNSSARDAAYVETFDGQMANKFTISFWAKGTPTNSTWNPWISKRGENNLGYQIRRNGSSSGIYPCFTIRGTPGADDPASGSTVDNDTWHHYAGTWDGTAGIRKLYVDGKQVLGFSGDTGPMAVAATDHLMLGARDSGGFGNWFWGLLYDVRVYSYALNALEVGTIVNPPTAMSLTLIHSTIPLNETVALGITIPAGTTATSPATVYLTNNSPSVVTIVGSTGNVFPVTFPVGTLVQTVYLKAVGPGQINITAGLAGVGEASLTTVNMVVAPKLIGRWLDGSADLMDKSTNMPAGTHDGIIVGANPDKIAFSTDIPAGHSGQSLDLAANATTNTTGGYNTVGVIITNSATSDTAYQPTFDGGMSSAFSVAFWAKGLPGNWNGFVSKRGESGIGWQVRRQGGNPEETFTIRGSGAGNEDPRGSIAITNGLWHHFAAVWDGITGTRKCYVDGVLDPNINLTGDFAPMNLAPNHHIGIGTREGGTPGTFEAWFAGKLYDVRVYNYPITADEVAALAVSTGPALTFQSAANNQVRISWPTSSAGFALEQSATLLPGSWSASSLTVTVEGSENVVYAPATGGAQFYRLKK